MSDRLGHSTTAITADLYTHVVPSLGRDRDCLIFGVTGPDTPRLLGGEGPAVTETIEPMAAQIDQQRLAEDLVAQAREEGVQLVGEGGLLTGLTKAVVETTLEEEISVHLGYDKHDPAGRNGGNSRNGVRSKTVLTEIGPVHVEVPRDSVLSGAFAPGPDVLQHPRGDHE